MSRKPFCRNEPGDNRSAFLQPGLVVFLGRATSQAPHCEPGQAIEEIFLNIGGIRGAGQPAVERNRSENYCNNLPYRELKAFTVVPPEFLDQFRIEPVRADMGDECALPPLPASAAPASRPTDHANYLTATRKLW